jgi:hypothetical protein
MKFYRKQRLNPFLEEKNFGQKFIVKITISLKIHFIIFSVTMNTNM